MKIGKAGLFLLVLMIGIQFSNPSSCYCYEEISYDTLSVSDLPYSSDIRYPQTFVSDIVTVFLSERTNKEKKVFVLGYDGFREDALQNIKGAREGAVSSILENGALYHSYAGADGRQQTSTAPGWLSILSGKWAYTLGIEDNEDAKAATASTFLSEAVASGYSSVFIASWATHFEVTYYEDILHPEGKPAYLQMKNDEETFMALQTIVSDTSQTSYDVIFATLEYTDHTGHSIGYGNEIVEYVDASRQVDRKAYQLLQMISQRETYEQEDWLIVITTDHGGVDRGHGGQSWEETNTWFAINKRT